MSKNKCLSWLLRKWDLDGMEFSIHYKMSTFHNIWLDLLYVKILFKKRFLHQLIYLTSTTCLNLKERVNKEKIMMKETKNCITGDSLSQFILLSSKIVSKDDFMSSNAYFNITENWIILVLRADKKARLFYVYVL